MTDPEKVAASLTKANDALDRMKRAYDRRTGCCLTAEMIADLGLTIFAEIWSQPREILKGNPDNG